MTFLPFQRIVLRSSLTQAVLIERLSAEVEPKRWLRMPFGRAHKPFEGTIQGETFQIARIIHYRNSFLPVIKGRVVADGQGSILEANLRLHAVVMGFMAFWMALAGTGFGGVLGYQVSHRKFDESLVITAGMVLFGYVLTMGGFLFEAFKARKLFEKLIDTPGPQAAR